MSTIEEYESQLADIETLLEESPNDDSLLKLKSDLLELIKLTKEEEGEGSDSLAHDQLELSSVTKTINASSELDNVIASLPDEPIPVETTKPVKISKPKTFEIPPHLQPLPSDTDAERKRKKRTLKALKAKHKSAEKEYESTKKQNAWLDFSKKKTKPKESIFRSDGDSKVGVVTAPIISTDANYKEPSSKRQRHNF
jgi:hypothetical protein